MLKNIVPIFILVLTYSCGSEKIQKKEVENSPLAIMAYYVPEKEYNPEHLPLKKLSHIIFSFSTIIDGEMGFLNEKSGKQLDQLVAQKVNYPQLKVMIACGGWGADGFSDAAFTEKSREKFISSAIAFIERHQLDGLDIDWEYPGISGAGTKSRKEDKKHFTLLIKGLQEELDKLDRPQTLSFASAGWKRYYENVELSEVMKYVDYMNVMTYDQAGGSSRFTSHHTALGLITVDDMDGYPLGEAMKKRNAEMVEGSPLWEPQSAEKIIEFCIKKGVNPNQIVLGAAFYGRAWKGVQPNQNGLYQHNNGPYSNGTSYAAIRKKYENKNGFTRYWDKHAKSPYLFNSTDSIFISYDDTASVKLKTRFAIEEKLGGIMFWQLSSDTKEKNSLLDAIFNETLH